MDKQIAPKKKRIKKIVLIGIPFILLLIVTVLNMTRKKQVNLERQSLSIREVTKDNFEDVILFNSLVKPKTSVLINVIQGGSVSEVYVESGQTVKKGDPLLRVYNPNAELNYLTQETAIIEQINNLRNIRVSIKNQQLNLNEQLLSIDNAFKNAERKYTIDTTLYKKDVIARNDFESSVQEYKYQKERNKVIKQSVVRENTDRNVQLMRINESIKNMQKSLSLLRENKENFIVKSPISGLLASFNPILGQNYNQGESVGKIDVLEGYKLVAKVDEYYSSKLQEGVKGVVNINNETHEVMIFKVHSEVVNGQFEVELHFTKDLALHDLKRGTSLQTKVFLSGSTEALLVSKGLFYQSTNGKWVFVLDENNKAVRRHVKIGRENPFYYEVLSGLQEGEKIITSSYDDFLDVEEININ